MIPTNKTKHMVFLSDEKELKQMLFFLTKTMITSTWDSKYIILKPSSNVKTIKIKIKVKKKNINNVIVIMKS